MTDQSTKSTGQKPTHRIYVVTGEGEKSTWTPIAAAWPHKDGKGFAINCTAIPIQGRIVMRAVSERDEQTGGQQ